MEHLLKIPCTAMPFVSEADYSVTLAPMIHADRTAPFHVAIYLLQGSMEIIEDGIPYRIMPDQVFFLKSGIHHYGKENLKLILFVFLSSSLISFGKIPVIQHTLPWTG